MRPMWSAPLVALLLLVAASSSSAEIQTCFLLRLRENNMEQVQAAALRGAGINPGGGTYLSPSEVADLSGRSPQDIQLLTDFIASHGGSLGDINVLRDAATACFKQAALDALTALHLAAAATTEHRQLVLSTKTSASPSPAALTASASAALSLAMAMPPHLAAMLHFVAPPHVPTMTTPATTSPDLHDAAPAAAHPGHRRSMRSLPSQQLSSAGTPRSGAKRATRRSALSSDAPAGYTYSAADLSLTLPGPYPGTTLQEGSDYLGQWDGLMDTASGISVGVPHFWAESALVYLGIFNVTYVLNHLNLVRMGMSTLMAPCSLQYNGSAVSAIQYATLSTATACAPSFTMTVTADYSAVGGQSMFHILTGSGSPFVTVTSCGAAVASSLGRLPSNLCTLISRQMAATTGVPNNIGNTTAIYTINWAAAGLPSYVALVNPVPTLVLAATMPEPYRSHSWTTSPTPGVPRSMAGANTPAELRVLYNSPLQNLGTSKGLVNAVMAPPGALYAMSPVDLATATSAFNVTAPKMTFLTNPPLFMPNNPLNVYGPRVDEAAYAYSFDIDDAAEDSQMLVAFGEGSGATTAFIASNSDPAYLKLGLPATFHALLGMNPLPDVVSYSSFGGVITSLYDLAATEASLAKLAAMGVTVITGSGNDGAFDPVFGTCADSISSVNPAASAWVTSIGGVQMASQAPGKAPIPVVCMASAGGVINSGGGFGNLSAGSTPAWQAKAVHKYIQSQSKLASWPLHSVVNPLAHYSVACKGGPGVGSHDCVYGRGFPDISFIAAAQPALSSGQPWLFYGTSALGAVFSGLMGQINAAVRATPGLEDKKIGFANPFLYWAAEHYPTAFYDVTVGGNNYNYGSTACALGYMAAEGWDAATGLGMPNIAVLQEAAVEYVSLQCKAK